MYINVVSKYSILTAVRCVGGDIPFSLLFWQSFSVAKISWDPCSAVHGVSKICSPIEKLYVLFLIVSGCKNYTAYGEARALKWFPLKKSDRLPNGGGGWSTPRRDYGWKCLFMSVDVCERFGVLYCFVMPCLVSLLLINF